MENQNIQLEHFKYRLYGRICIVFITITQIAQRIRVFITSPALTHFTHTMYIVTLPPLAIMSLLAVTEFIIYKKFGSKALKYSGYLNGAFFIFFLCEWWLTIYTGYLSIKRTPFYYLTPSTSLVFTAFTWRILIQNFIVERWYLKLIGPIGAYIIVLFDAIHFDPKNTGNSLFRGLLQITYVILIYFFDNKISLSLLLTNTKREQWVKINEFILDNIPEKIALFDFKGGVKYQSLHLRKYMRNLGYGSDTEALYSHITDLKFQVGSESVDEDNEHVIYSSSLN